MTVRSARLLVMLLVLGGCSNHAPTATGAGPSGKAVAELPKLRDPGSPRFATTILRVGDAPNASCADVAVDPTGTDSPVIINSCHGWDISSCSGHILAVSRGIRLDRAILLLAHDGRGNRRRLQLDDVLTEALTRRFGPAQELLQLDYHALGCSQDGAYVPFEASYIGRDASGPASGIDGSITLDADGHHSVTFRP